MESSLLFGAWFAQLCIVEYVAFLLEALYTQLWVVGVEATTAALHDNAALKQASQLVASNGDNDQITQLATTEI